MHKFDEVKKGRRKRIYLYEEKQIKGEKDKLK